jgi:gamma-glutamylcyclotransferase
MLYFAYGSNMNWRQIRERCPSVRFVGTALLPDHKLAFTRKSIKRGCGVADAVPERDKKIWGIVYDINALDIRKLDTAEGYWPGRLKNSYFRRECMVLLDGDDQQSLAVFTYYGDPQPNPPLPNIEYKNLILSGARHWRLPAEYVQQLDEQIKVSG